MQGVKIGAQNYRLVFLLMSEVHSMQKTFFFFRNGFIFVSTQILKKEERKKDLSLRFIFFKKTPCSTSFFGSVMIGRVVSYQN